MDMEKMRQQLLDRIRGNYADYRADLLLKDQQELIDGADRIAKTAEVFQYFTKYRLTEQEIVYFIKFQNPLEVAADHWNDCTFELDALGAVIADAVDKEDDLTLYPLAADVSDGKQGQHMLPKNEDLRPLSEDQLKHIPQSPWEYGSKWNLYIIPDLKTWTDNAGKPTPLELFSSFEAAKARFEELRGENYNSEAAEPDPYGQPPARLTLGIETADDMDAYDILCVRQGENYLANDFTKLDRLRDDPVAMEIISRISHEIGFDYVRFYGNIGGQTRLQPKVPFVEWVNSCVISSTPGGVAAKECCPDRKPSIKAQLAAKPVPGDKPSVKPKDREVR